jgi:acetyl esterase/lipase
VNYITNDDPPFLIVQGEQDRILPPSQSEELYDRLTAAGVQATLVMVANAGHGFVRVSGTINPSRAEIMKTMADFFDNHLQGGIGAAGATTTTMTPTTNSPAWILFAALMAVVAIAVVVIVIILRRPTSRKVPA